MPTPGEHKTVQARILAYASALLLLAPATGWSQCVLQAPGWDGTSVCGGAIVLGGVVQSGTPTLNWNVVPACPGCLDLTNTNAPVFSPPASNTDITYTFTITGAGCVGSPLVVEIEVLATPGPGLSTNTAGLQSGSTLYSDSLAITWSACGTLPPFDVVFNDAATVAQGGAAYAIDWGNGQTLPLQPLVVGWAGIQQSYPNGLSVIDYTITNPNGCSGTTSYGVFISSGLSPVGPWSAPSLFDFYCAPETLVFPVTNGFTNPPGTVYTLEVSDGRPDSIMIHPLPASIDVVFDLSSCGFTAGNYQNAFELSIIAENPCGQSGQTLLRPVRIANAPVASFTVSDPDLVVCTTQNVQFNNTSVGSMITGTGFGASCLDPDTLYWTITPAAGINLIGGSALGTNNGNPNTPTAWSLGTDNIAINFSTPGTYTVELHVANGCGIDDEVRTICVEAPPVAGFSLPFSTGCLPGVGTLFPIDQSSPNATCSAPSYQWSVAQSALCGVAPDWDFQDPVNDPISPDPGFIFNAPGTYTLSLTVDNVGCAANSTSGTVTIQTALSLEPFADTTLCDLEPLPLYTANVLSCDTATPIIMWTYVNLLSIPVMPVVPGPDFGPILSPVAGTVTVVATSPPWAACAGTSTQSFDITLSQSAAAPTVTVGAVDACDNASVQLLVDGIVGLTYLWTGPGGYSSPLEDPILLPPWLPGTYTVVASLSGCDGPPASVTVSSNPSPAVSATSGTLCDGQVADTMNASGALTYEWFSGGPPVLWSAEMYIAPAGSYYVVGTAANGCTDTAYASVAPDNGVVDFSAPDTICLGAPVNFMDLSTGVSAWNWDFGDNLGSTNPSPTHLYATAGTFYVTLTGNASGDCPVIHLDTVVVNLAPDVSFVLSSTLVCDSEVVAFTNTTAVLPAWYQWNVNGTLYTNTDPPDQPFPSGLGVPITVYVSLTGTSPACPTDTESDSIIIEPDPIAQLSYSWSAPPCSPFDVTFTNISIANGTVLDSINFGDGSPTLAPFPNAAPLVHTFTTGLVPTTYVVTLYTNNDCGASVDTVHITVQPALVSSFFDPPEAVCLDSLIQFTSLAVGAQTWLWDFDDGNSSPLASPTHQYALPGTYLVTLDVTGFCGAAQWQDSIEVLPLPIAAFSLSATEVCLGTQVQVTSVTPGMSGYTWHFDNVQYTTTLPAHVFTTSGQHTVSLEVLDQQSPACGAAAQAVVQVNDTSVVTISPVPPECVPYAASFQTNALFTTAYYWDFGDGTTSVMASPVHVYDTAGTYIVTLLSTNPDSCSSSQSLSVTALPTPIPGFALSVPDSCAGGSSPVQVTVTDLSTGAGAWHWEFGNGDTSNVQAPVAVYDGPGTYIITQTVTNAEGCDSTTTGPLTLYPEPAVTALVFTDPACLGQPVSFSESTLNATQWIWMFGDGASGSGPTVQHAYSDTGTFVVSVTATGQGSCVVTDTAEVIVCPSPIAAFDTLWSAGGVTQFVNLSEGAIGYQWDFGDDSTSTAFEPRHTFGYAPDCMHPVRLIAMNGCGCTDTITRPFRIFVEPPFHVANTATFNGDGVNDLFRPEFPSHLFAVIGTERYRFTIIDRWDHDVFDSKDPFAEWDGTFLDGKPVPTGVYNWILEYHSPCTGEGWRKMGHVTVLR